MSVVFKNCEWGDDSPSPSMNLQNYNFPSTHLSSAAQNFDFWKICWLKTKNSLTFAPPKAIVTKLEANFGPSGCSAVG